MASAHRTETTRPQVDPDGVLAGLELPADLDADIAGCLPDYMLAHALFTAGTRGLAVGTAYVPASPLNTGIVFVQLATLAGWKVAASAESAAQAALLSDAGAVLAFDRTSEKPVDRIAAWTGGKGVNVVIDLHAGSGFEDHLKLLADFGDLFCCGWDQGDPPDFHQMMWRNLDRCPRVRIWSLQRYRDDQAGRARLLSEVIALMQSRGVRPPVQRTVA